MVRRWGTYVLITVLLAGTACRRGPDGRADAEAKVAIDSACESAATTNQSTTGTGSGRSSTSEIAGDVELEPGDGVASMISDSPAGTVFVFSPGVYEGLSIKPKAGQMFVGEPGAVLRGEEAEYAFRSAEPGVTIEGLVVEGYAPEPKDGVIHGEQGARDWTVAGNQIRHNGEIGIDGVSGWKVSRNVITHNGRYGLTLSGTDLVVEGNEIACNSTDYGATGDSGGTKFVHTDNLIIRENYVHDNYGNGLWVDINNVDALIDENRLVGNARAGVFIEISCGGIIRNNQVERNGLGKPYPDWLAGSSGIQVTDTPNVSIYENVLSENIHGIGALQVDHENLDAVTKCDPQLTNLKVHDNEINQSGGAAAGLDANNSLGDVWSSWGNTFEGNTYNLSDGARFRWEGDWITEDGWTDQGNS